MKKIILFWIAFIFVTVSSAQDLTGIRIYINPGHGGFDSDDRNIVISPFTSGDHNGFWESQSNLDKGIQLKALLDASGATTFISRTTNTTADDLPLSQIVAAANAANADFMLSIHSNAGNGTANHVLALYAGIDATDTYTYPTATPKSDESRAISTVIAKNLYSNEITNWTSSYTVRGDKTFARTAMGWSDGYGVLRGLTVPGEISEGEMHDYIPETYRLMNMDYKYLEAWHFYKSFCSYFEAGTIPTGIIAGAVRDKFLLNEASYNKIGTDLYLPVNKATVTLLPNKITYTTDTLRNGVYLFKDLEPGDYTIVTEHSDYHPDTSYVSVTANTVTYNNVSLNKIRNTPPEVVDYSPNVALTDSVMAGSSIWMKFNWDIDPESAKEAFSISPVIEGEITFEDSNYSMRFTPDKPLEKSTIYTVTLSTALSHYDGLSMVSPFSFQFKTASRNELKLIAAYPLANETNIDYATPTFTFVFDKQLQTSELINGVQVYDKDGNLVSKVTRSLKHNTVESPYGSTLFTLSNDLVPGESYVVKLAKGIQDIDGVFLADTLKIPFTVSNERVTDKEILETFENSGEITYDDTQSSLVTSASASRTSTKKLFDSYSYNLTYSFSANSGGELVYKFANPTIKVTTDSVIGLHIYGDLSGNNLYLILQSDNSTEYIKLDSIHYGGWKFAETNLKQLQDNTEYTLTGFEIKQTSAPLSDTGNLYLDNLLVYNKEITSVTSPKLLNILVYPNPASDFVFIQTYNNQSIKEINLYNLSGRKILTSLQSPLQISQIAAGTYIIKVILNEGIFSNPIIIKK